MNNSEKSTKKSASRKNGLLKLVFKFGVFIALFLFIIGAVYLINNLSVESFFRNDTDELISDTPDNFYNQLLSENKYESYEVLYKLTPEELTDILSAFTIPEKFSMTTETVNYSAGKTQITTNVILYDRDEYSLNRYESGKLIESITCDNNEITFKDELRARSNVFPKSDEFTFEKCCSIPALSELTRICTEILSSSEKLLEYDISLVAGEEDCLYRVVFTYPDINQKEEYYVSEEKSMIVGNYSYINGNLYYRYLVTDFKEGE